MAARSQLKRVHGWALAGLVLATGITLFVSALKDEQRAPQRKVATAVARRTALAPLLAAELRRVAQTPRELYVALHDGTVKRSADGGRTWAIRSTP